MLRDLHGQGFRHTQGDTLEPAKIGYACERETALSSADAIFGKRRVG
jgi:hypothetical protein